MLVNHALLKNRVGSASRKYVESYQITFSAFGRSTFHPRPCLPAGRHRTGFSSAALNKMDGTADNNNMGRLQKGVEIENVSHRKTQRIF